MPEIDDDDDRRCRFKHPPGHEKAGQQCAGMHIVDSAFCNWHSGNIIAHNKKAKEKGCQQAALEESLTGDYHELKTRGQVRDFTEKLINGIMQGVIKKDKAAPMAVFLPLIWKQAQVLEKEGVHGGSSFKGMQITVKDQKTINIQMSPQDVDKFLEAKGGDAMKVLEELENNGQIQKIERGGDGAVNVTAKDITDESTRIDSRAIAKITERSGSPITPKQATRIFGKSMAGADVSKSAPNGTLPPGPGFDHLFEKDFSGLPTEAQPKPHKWVKGYTEPHVVQGVLMAENQYTCEWCGLQTLGKKTDEHCPEAKYETEN